MRSWCVLVTRIWHEILPKMDERVMVLRVFVKLFNYDALRVFGWPLINLASYQIVIDATHSLSYVSSTHRLSSNEATRPHEREWTKHFKLIFLHLLLLGKYRKYRKLMGRKPLNIAMSNFPLNFTPLFITVICLEIVEFKAFQKLREILNKYLFRLFPLFNHNAAKPWNNSWSIRKRKCRKFKFSANFHTNDFPD